MGRRVVLVLVAALPMLAVAGAAWGYAAAPGVVAATLQFAGTAATPVPGRPGVPASPGGIEIDRGFRLPAPSCSIDPGFHLRIPGIEQLDPGFGPVPSPPPDLPRCSDTPAPATPAPRP